MIYLRLSLCICYDIHVSRTGFHTTIFGLFDLFVTLARMLEYKCKGVNGMTEEERKDIIDAIIDDLMYLSRSDCASTEDKK